MRKRRSFRQAKKWIIIAIIAMMITPTGSVWAKSILSEENKESTLLQEEVDNTTSVVEEEATITPTEDNKEALTPVSDDIVALSELKREIPAPTVMPFAEYALSEPTKINMVQESQSYIYNMENLRTEVISFKTTVQTTFGNTADSGTFPTNSTIELTSSSPIAKIEISKFNTIKSASGTHMQIYANSDTTPFYDEAISDSDVTVSPPKDTLVCKVLFTGNTVTPSKDIEISTYVNVNMSTPVANNMHLNTNVTIPKNSGGSIAMEDTEEFIDIKNLTQNGFIQGFFGPSIANIISAEDLKKSPKVAYDMDYSLIYQNSDPYRTKNPKFFRLKDTSFQSSTDEDMILKELVILEGFSGQTGIGFSAAETFDLYINDELFQKDLLISKGYTATFSDEIHREFKIVLHDGVVQKEGKDRYKPNQFSAIYECKGDGTKGAYPIYVEGKTKFGKNIISSLDPIPSEINVQSIYTYFLQTPFLKNNATKAVHSVGENIVFNLTDLYAGKFKGDYSECFLTFDTSTDLKEYYYLKQVDLVPIVYPDNLLVNQDKIKLQLYDGTTQTTATGKKISDKLYSYTNDNTSISSSQMSEIKLKPVVKSINRDMLTGDPYSIFAAVNQSDLRDFTVKLTYAPRPDKTITEDMVFTNNVWISMSPSNKLNDTISKSLISGMTKIQVTSEPGNPEPGNPEPGKPEPGKPEPGKPEPGNPEPGNPEPGNPEPGNPEPGKPDVGNQQQPNLDPSLKDTHDPTVKNTPDTGDSTNAGIWFGLLLFTGVSSVILSRYKNKSWIKNK